MAWCENCKKDNLRKADVEFCDSTHKVLCHGCYTLAHPGWMPPVEIVDMTTPPPAPPQALDYVVSLSARDGFRAQVSVGDVSLKVHAPMDQFMKYLGPG
jgi:hypothetical protein